MPFFNCHKVLSEDEGTIVDEKLLCDECVNDHCITCDSCGETIWTENCVTDDNTYLCQDCFDNNYNRCERCGRIIREYDTSWYDDLPYCYSCYDEVDNDGEIEEYSYKPDPVFYGDSYIYFGVELEVDKGGKDGENARILKDIANDRNEHIYIKSDSSLNTTSRNLLSEHL